jgi:amidophosphoribosyltransferase
VNSPYGIAFAHNGNLVNTETLRREMFEDDRRHINTDSDSEVLLNVLAHELQIQDRMALTPDHIFKAVAGVHARARGGYACVALVLGYGLLAFRDPERHPSAGARRARDPEGREYAVASESVALDMLGFKRLRDIAPGEAVIITDDGQLHTRRCAPTARAHAVHFRIRLSRASRLDDRGRLGLQGAPAHGREAGREDPARASRSRHRRGDPDSRYRAHRASALAAALGVPFREGFVKNRYIGRTFIMPGQGERVKSVRRKLNAVDLEFRKKNVLLVDDSIVRGTTSKQIIQMARDAGAKNVYFASAAPPVRYPNVYGIDMPAASELVAAGTPRKKWRRCSAPTG